MNRHSIKAIHWQIQAQARLYPPMPMPANIVVAYEDIEQEIRTIILTPIGCVPTNPLKGCDLLPLIDMPGNLAAPLAAQRIHDALTLWVRRIEVGEVSVAAISVSEWRIKVPWRVRAEVESQFRLYEMDLDLGGGDYAQG